MRRHIAVADAWTFNAIGTSWHIELPDLTTLERATLEGSIADLIDTFDENYSRFREDSLVTKMSEEAGNYRLPKDAEKLFDLYSDLYDRTNGKMTPLIGQLLTDAGYDADYSLLPKTLSEVPSLESVLTYKFPNLTLHQPALLDFGAAGKGYLVDLVCKLIEETSQGPYIVDAGGDMRIRARAPLQIGLEHPDDPKKVIGVASLTSGSICGSAGNRRAWGDFHHIMDPHERASTTHLKAAWVVAPEAIIADALTTALFFTSPEELQKGYTFEYLLMRADNSVQHSPAFPAELFLAPS